MVRRPCSKCGSVDHPKYRRMKKRESGIRTPMMSSYCVLCHAEDQKVREERRYKKKLAYNRRWRKEHRDKKNASARKYYWRAKARKVQAINDPGVVEWHKTVRSNGFSAMTYTPMYVGGGW